MTMNIALSKVFVFFLAFSLTLGMLISSVGASISHLPIGIDSAEQSRHAQLAPEGDDHGHSHEDGEFEEQQPNHTHNHNPADHSHETPHLSGYIYLISRDLTRIHFIAIPESLAIGDLARLDRPPKPVSLI